VTVVCAVASLVFLSVSIKGGSVQRTELWGFTKDSIESGDGKISAEEVSDGSSCEMVLLALPVDKSALQAEKGASTSACSKESVGVFLYEKVGMEVDSLLAVLCVCFVCLSLNLKMSFF